MLNLIVIVLAHWNNILRLDMSLHSETLFWFRANLSSLFLLNAASLAEKQQIPGLESTIYHTLGEHANHYATDAVDSG